MIDEQRALCESLAAEFADVRAILAEHLEDNDELLTHVFMGDVTRYVCADGPQRAGIVQRLERAFAECAFLDPFDKIQNLIAASFIENIETRDDLELALRGVAANELRAEWQRQNED